MILLGLGIVVISALLASEAVQRLCPLRTHPGLHILLSLIPFSALGAFCGAFESVVKGARPLWILSIEVFVLAILWILLRQQPAISIPTRLMKTPQDQNWLNGVFWFFFLLVATWAILITWAHPHGGWDAWGIWNLKARFLYRAGGGVGATFVPTMAWSHPDYPLLLPALVSHLWVVLGRETPWVPAALALLFTFGSVLLLRELVRFERGALWGNLAGLFLLGTSSFLRVGLEQIADLPLGFFLLAAFGFLRMAKMVPASKKPWLYAYLTIALAVWIKNEGILLALLFAGVLEMERSTSQVKSPFLGWPLALSLLVLWVVKTRWQPANDLTAAWVSHSVVFKLFNYRRWAEIQTHMATVLVAFAHGMLPGLVLFRWACGDRRTKKIDPKAVGYLGALLMLIALYFVVYLMSPYNVAWHIHSSFPRLLAQVVPSVLLMLFVTLPKSVTLVEERRPS